MAEGFRLSDGQWAANSGAQGAITTNPAETVPCRARGVGDTPHRDSPPHAFVSAAYRNARGPMSELPYVRGLISGLPFAKGH